MERMLDELSIEEEEASGEALEKLVEKRIEDPKLLRKISSPLLQHVEAIHKDLRPLKAIRLLNAFIESFEFHRSLEGEKKQLLQQHHSLDAEELDKLVRDIERLLEEKSVYIDRLKQEYGDIQAFLAECRVPDSEYEIIKQDSEWKTSMKKDSGSNQTKTFRVEGNIEANVESVCAVLSEVDLFPTWVPKFGNVGLQEIEELCRISKATSLVYMMMGLPWPMSPRYMNLYAFGVEVLEDDYLVIVLKTVTDLPGYKLKKVDGMVDLEVTGGCLIKPISPTHTRVTFVFRTDPKIAYIPYSLINWGMKKFAHYAFTMLGNHAKKLGGTEYEKRMKTNTDLYGDLGARLKEYFEKKQQKNTSGENIK
eukprot:TRINITY_DN6022_c0_g1_i2.p1 TRINITY_DN6022_c0_g1~~TRINITY_DN6022_c0_g1_i2.p1  ORF type:complete len:365 (+),score=111.37 TRINITY_DN6022_c0_g1_i2:177-1271(+)